MCGVMMPTKNWSRKRKLELSEQQASVGLEAEDQESKLTQQEREDLLREEMKEAMHAGILEIVQRALKETPMRLILTEEENKKVVDDAELDLARKLGALAAEFAMIMGTCYMQQEMLEIKGQADPVQNHRFKLVPLGALGVYKPDRFNCNEANKGHLLTLMKNLSRTLYIQNEKREDAVQGYMCRHCRRSLCLFASRGPNHVHVSSMREHFVLRQIVQRQ